MSEELLKTILGKLDEMDKTVQIMDGNIQRMDDKIQKMDDKIQKMDDKIQKMDDKIDRIEQKLDATFEQTAKSAESINEIAAAQDRHERVLEVLSLRSIEQQAFRSNKAP
ncbi:hypothetical protein [uncultured Paenibacillus sp.]|uniref:hypothetical protein n=1 Tax=uncultured Paenibacillus sp. TaxID=227322 RepID=UPI0028D6AD3E|nr:hypothetical protein [uncultured Paenibacillus sp.]